MYQYVFVLHVPVTWLGIATQQLEHEGMRSDSDTTHAHEHEHACERECSNLCLHQSVTRSRTAGWRQHRKVEHSGSTTTSTNTRLQQQQQLAQQAAQ